MHMKNSGTLIEMNMIMIPNNHSKKIFSVIPFALKKNTIYNND